MADKSSLGIAVNIFTSPNEAFAALREQPRVLLPILVLLVGYCAVSFVYMNAVDLPWFMDVQLQSGSANLTDAQREQAVTAAASVSPMVYGAVFALTSIAFVLLWMFVTAAYYTGVSFVTNDGVKLKQWFALICWCALPTVLGIVAQLVNLMASDARFMLQDAINPLSFGNLFSIEREGASILQRTLLSIDLTALWALVLTVLGYQTWTKSSMVKTVAIVLGPLAVIVAIGTLLALT
ncbi:MAG TPA: YIP1 family protein [Gammaproteobacteria bacterium]|nr:YIP1 family protein [Gammaproteobacteria bacterium]